MIRSPRAVLALLTALNLLNYIDRWVLSAVLPLVQDDLHVDNFVSGWFATAFLLGYFLTSPLFGALADRGGVRGGRKGLMATGVAVWSAATAVTGFAGGAASMLATRAVVGVGEASYGTVAPTLIDDMAGPSKRARWLSIFYLAIPVGSALGFLIGGAVGKYLGWRAAFFIVGVPGMITAALCLLLVEPAREAPKAAVDLIATARKLAAVPLYRRAVLGYAAQTFAMGGFSFWSATFLYRTYHLPLATASGTFGAIAVVAGGGGTVLGGAWADRRIARAGATTDDARASAIALRLCAITSFVAAPLAAACFFAPTATWFFVLGFFCELALFASTSPVNAAVLGSVPTHLRASAMALSIFAIHAFGDLWSPPLLGFFMDHAPGPLAMMAIPAAIAVSAAVWWLPPATPPAISSGSSP